MKQLLCLLLPLALLLPVAADENARKGAIELMQQGNFKEAFEAFERFMYTPDAKNPQVARDDLNNAISCLQRLNRQAETDTVREKIATTHPQNFHAQWAAGMSFLHANHHGVILNGAFKRGHHRGGGAQAHVTERDRVRAAQLLQRALELAEGQRGEDAVAYDFASVMIGARGGVGAWQLSALTDLTTLPDPEEGWYYGRRGVGHAAVDEQGRPVFYDLPESWQAAKNDGERWRWLLSKSEPNNAKRMIANWSRGQFGVPTMAQYGWWFGRMSPGNNDKGHTFALHTLGENETMAKLATGIQRFELPKDYNFIKLYQELQDHNQLGSIFQDRRQFGKAADEFRKAGNQHQLQQIVGNWGIFESLRSQRAGVKPVVDYKFRNGKSVTFTAKAIDVDKLLKDTWAYLKSNPGRLDWQQLNIANIGYRIVNQNAGEYVGEQVATWTEKLDPADDHWDRRVPIEMPMTKPGAYFVEANLKDGNQSRIIVWVNDTVMVKKNLATDQPGFFYLADADTGKPIPNAEVDLIGYWQEYVRDPKGRNNKHIVHTKELRTETDGNGIARVSQQDAQDNDKNNRGRNLQWIASARTQDGRRAWYGFSNIWKNNYHDQQYNATRTFGITDRPVYRPGQTVKIKGWVRKAQYDQENVSQFAGKNRQLTIHNPKGEKVRETQHKLDNYGGFESEFELPEDAALGVWRLGGLDNMSFRVEEYKKPEFEVTVEAPDKPVTLGEQLEAKVIAKYYFGAPVENATVKVKVTRTTHDENWYAPAPWDWFYGPGYWWFCYDYPWWPGWGEWGCWAPSPWVVPPPTGTAGNRAGVDHRDRRGRRADRPHRHGPGQGDARRPRPRLHADRRGDRRLAAHHRRQRQGAGRPQALQGEPLGRPRLRAGGRRGDDPRGRPHPRRQAGAGQGQAHHQAHRLRQEHGAGGDGPRDLRPRHRRRWKDPQAAQSERTGAVPGQLHARRRAGHQIEGGYVMIVRGDGFDGKEFRFAHLELVPEKAEYAHGETVKLMVNSDRAGAQVLLFVRPSNGACLDPEILTLKGKSVVHEIPITKKDMPNFFVEAITVFDGRVHQEMKEIIVPPEERVVNVDVLPSSERFLPGEEATVNLKLTDHEGNPVVGQVVFSVYDKSVEYISGGSNVKDIREFFWKWRRRHNLRLEHSFARGGGHIHRNNEHTWQPLGVFGWSVASDSSVMSNQRRNGRAGGIGGGGAMMAKGRSMRMAAAPAPGAAMADAFAAAPMQMQQAAGLADFARDEGGALAAADPSGAPAGQTTQLAEAKVRENFADTAFWLGAREVAADGTTSVTFEMPENLTGWKIRAWSMSHGTRVGVGEAEVVTAKNLLVRLQAPRFFVEKDEVVLSANVHNYLDEEKESDRRDRAGGRRAGVAATRGPPGAGAGQRRDPGRLAGQGDRRGRRGRDHEGADRRGVGRHEDDLPRLCARGLRDRLGERRHAPRPGIREVRDQHPAGAARGIRQAGGPLVPHPSGCDGGRDPLSRRLPVWLHRADPEPIPARRAGAAGAARHGHRPQDAPGEAGEPERPGNRRSAQKRAAQWKRFKRNPVFDQELLEDMVDAGLERLTSMQCRDGGWGWFSGAHEHSSSHTTAYVVHGLQVARPTTCSSNPTCSSAA